MDRKVNDLTKVLDAIGKDIMRVLANYNSKLTQTQLYRSRSDTLTNYHENGWSYALSKLEAMHLIEFVDPCYWQLKNPIRKHYIEELQDFTNTKITPD